MMGQSAGDGSVEKGEASSLPQFSHADRRRVSDEAEKWMEALDAPSRGPLLGPSRRPLRNEGDSMFSSIGLPELLVIMAILLLLFGSRRLPELGSSLGRAISEFKHGLQGGATRGELPEKPEAKQ